MNKSNKEILIEIGIGVIIGILLVAPIFVYQHMQLKNQPEPITTIERDTAYVHSVDTVYVPKSVIQYVEVRTIDTLIVEKDSTLEVQQKHYKDTISDIWISGYMPQIDSIQYRIPKDTVLVNTEIERIIPQKKSFWENRFYLGVGVSGGYNIISRQPDIMVGLQAGFRIL